MFNLRQKYRNVKRAKEILTVFAKFGLAYFFDLPAVEKYLNLGRKFFMSSGQTEKNIAKLSLPQRTRLAFETLGPTFIKLGQVLSTRPDLIPKEFIDELIFLQDEVPAFPFTQVEDIIKTEFGKPINEIFVSFEEIPLAAASLSQVHRAELTSGETVAVKIQRPHIKQAIETDLIILHDLARLMEKRMVNGHLYQPVEIVNEFSKYIRLELDFMNEGRNLDRFNENFKEIEYAHFPRVFWDLTTAKVITMEYIPGEKISAATSAADKIYDKKLIASYITEAMLKQIFIDGFFHGDPHPGNIFIMPDNKIAFLDCGLAGRLDRGGKELLADMLIAVINNDADRIIIDWQDMEIIGPNADLKIIKTRLSLFLDKFLNLPIKNLNIGEILTEFMEIMISCQVKVPTDLVLLSKAIVTIESVGSELDGDYNLVERVRPFAEKLISKKFEPKEILERGGRTVKNFIKLAENFPEDWRWFNKSIRHGDLNIGIKHRNLEKLILIIDHASNRLSFSLIIAALIIGSSFIMDINRGPFILGFPALGVVGYLIAGILGLGLIFSIIKKGRF